MIIPPQPPPLPAVQPASTTPQNNAALATAAVAAQKIAKPTQTQTKRAPSAVAQGDASRETTDSRFVGRAFDSEAAAVEARTNSPPPRGRGDRLDVSV
ncbi:hypothetical protein CHU95_06485 [Niveispirillum lacus]|uniref:Uncharacterized protein n=1 Tax=Niveispirillum lacus TaxID=1981099 RepID=A0A255Z4R4_9PROT|nr:hypothetical protein [Niveispirillum lacus]OYQ35904.1 hypothetical protein CHU95_06485 [Niveispirillum lacus]